MSRGVDHTLASVIRALDGTGASYFLVHQAGALALGLCEDPLLAVDVCLTDGELDAARVTVRPGYVECELAGRVARLWDVSSLAADGGVRVVRSRLYGCEVLAPDLLLECMGRSPDAASLARTLALLACVVHVDGLSDEQLADAMGRLGVSPGGT